MYQLVLFKQCPNFILFFILFYFYNIVNVVIIVVVIINIIVTIISTVRLLQKIYIFCRSATHKVQYSVL